MGNVIYLMNASLDGFVAGPGGEFGWTRPDEEIHRFHNHQASEMGAFLNGRRMYETMRVWQTYDQDRSLPDYVAEFARIWRSKPKVVFSTTLETVGENCRLVRDNIPAEVERLRRQIDGDLAVSGPSLASTLASHRLIDEYRLVVYPVLVGGGKSYFPRVDRIVALRLVDSKVFRSGALYLRYRCE